MDASKRYGYMSTAQDPLVTTPRPATTEESARARIHALLQSMPMRTPSQLRTRSPGHPAASGQKPPVPTHGATPTRGPQGVGGPFGTHQQPQEQDQQQQQAAWAAWYQQYYAAAQQHAPGAVPMGQTTAYARTPSATLSDGQHEMADLLKTAYARIEELHREIAKLQAGTAGGAAAAPRATARGDAIVDTLRCFDEVRVTEVRLHTGGASQRTDEAYPHMVTVTSEALFVDDPAESETLAAVKLTDINGCLAMGVAGAELRIAVAGTAEDVVLVFKSSAKCNAVKALVDARHNPKASAAAAPLPVADTMDRARPGVSREAAGSRKKVSEFTDTDLIEAVNRLTQGIDVPFAGHGGGHTHYAGNDVGSSDGRNGGAVEIHPRGGRRGRLATSQALRDDATSRPRPTRALDRQRPQRVPSRDRGRGLRWDSVAPHVPSPYL